MERWAARIRANDVIQMCWIVLDHTSERYSLARLKCCKHHTSTNNLTFITSKPQLDLQLLVRAVFFYTYSESTHNCGTTAVLRGNKRYRETSLGLRDSFKGSGGRWK